MDSSSSSAVAQGSGGSKLAAPLAPAAGPPAPEQRVQEPPQEEAFVYFIKMNIAGAAADKVRELSAAAAARFPQLAEPHGTYSRGWSTPHTTVKYYFAASDEQIAAVCDALAQFARRQTEPVGGSTLVGGARFPADAPAHESVVFCEHRRSPAALQLVRDAVALLHDPGRFGWLKWRLPQDGSAVDGPVLHSTIAKAAGVCTAEVEALLAAEFGSEPIEYVLDTVSVCRTPVVAGKRLKSGQDGGWDYRLFRFGVAPPEPE